MNQPMSVEQLPNKFEPYRKNRWVFDINDEYDLTPYLMKSISMSGFNMENRTRLTLRVHSSTSVNVMGPVMRWMLSAERKTAQLKFLDSMGTVQDMWVFDVVPDQVIPDPLDYDDSEIHMLTIVLDAELISTFNGSFQVSP